MNLRLSSAACALITTSLATAQGPQYHDNFDNYVAGMSVDGQSTWAGWDNTPAAGQALVVTAPAGSTPNALEIDGPDDLVEQYSGYTTGRWVFTARQYIPTGMTGQQYFILLNTYNVGPAAPKNWSLQLFAQNGMITDADVTLGSTPILFDQWVEYKVVIDLTADTQTVWYGSTLMGTKSWTAGASGGGALNIGAVDLFNNGGSVVYWDDVSIQPCETPFTQSLDRYTIGASVACNAMGLTVPNGFGRVYDPVLDLGLECTDSYSIDCVSFGLDLVFDGTGASATPANVKIFRVDDQGALPGITYGTMTLLHDESIVIPDQTNTLFSVPLSPAVSVDAGTPVYVEVSSPVDGTANGSRFFVGQNAGGQTGPSYIRAAGCGAPDPLDLAVLGLPNNHLLLAISATGVPATVIGTNYCTTVPNSTGMPGMITAVGSDTASANDVTLHAGNLPPFEFAYFLASDGNIEIPNPSGAPGNFCLWTNNLGNIGRYSNFVQNTGANGCISLEIDLTMVPIAAAPGSTVLMAGTTWYFQCWHRDTGSNNFTNAVGVTFN